MPIRSPIIVVMGHVDHGKTTILDTIRGSNVAAKEAGAITQMIGASYVPKSTIDKLSQSLAKSMQFELRIPGLLFIDTPGHEAFTNLRDRGGSIADMAILVVDIQQGFQPQTIESLHILKQYKTPFIIAANKIDLVHGWKSNKTTSFGESASRQPEHVQQALEEKLYSLMGKISEYGFDSERFDKIKDFSKQIALLPVSGKTKEGLSELLMLIGGLSQRFLGSELQIDPTSKAKGSILEIKEERGLGTTMDVIIYDGILKKNDDIVFLTPEGARDTKVRALLEPGEGGEKFRYIDDATAAAGVKIFASGLEDALPGSPFKAVENLQADKTQLEEQFKHIVFETAGKGIVLCADSLGSVEALLKLVEGKIPVKEAKVGKITRKEILTAKAVALEDKHLGAVLGFNVPILDEARAEAGTYVPIIWSNIVYDLIDRYHMWVKEEKEKEKQKALTSLPWPGKIKLLPDHCFRMSKPAVFGVEVLVGKIKNGVQLVNAQGERIAELKGIQHEKKALEEAEKGMEVAIACEGIVYGRDVKENDVLYVNLSKDELDGWEKQKALLSSEEKQLLEELRSKMRIYF